MKLGVTLPLSDIGGGPATVRLFAEAAEEASYDQVAASDHVLGVNVASWPGWGRAEHLGRFLPRSFVLFGFLSGCTTRMGFSTQVRQTVLVAKQAACLDVLSGVGSMSLLSAKYLHIYEHLCAGRPGPPELAGPLPDGIFPTALKEGTMAEAKLAPNLPDWMVEHANRYLASGGTDGHMYKITVPGRGEITAPALLLTTTGRKSGDKFIFPLFYGTDGGSYFVIASKGGAPQHPGWYRNILANPDVEVQVGTKKLKARARTTAGEERLRLWKKALEFWPPYADYQLKTEREIPVVVLDPVQ
jgi:deazaflavin-dependent oxidoreductase (nitroreductase family)